MCVIYFGGCTDSDDGLNWGHTYYLKGAEIAEVLSFSESYEYTQMNGHCNDYSSHLRFCDSN